jgi:oligopeptide transport system ATP-binding protein
VTSPLVEVSSLKKYFPVSLGLSRRSVRVRAVDDVTFDLKRGETLGCVGESGCGKSTLGRLIVRLIEPTEGDVRFEGESIYRLKSDALRRLRRNMQIVFQDPYSSLNPRMRVEKIIARPMEVHGLLRGNDAKDIVGKLVERVGLSKKDLDRYPHEFSGGQRQRIAVARALSLEPEFLVLDEPTSALDVSVQSQILNLLKTLQSELTLTYLFISHNLSVVRHMSVRVAVMYLGRIVEIADSQTIFERPLHPYTKALISAIPVQDPERRKERVLLKGDPPSPVNPPSGCRFHPRCPVAVKRCEEEDPQLREVESGHFVACHLAP